MILVELRSSRIKTGSPESCAPATLQLLANVSEQKRSLPKTNTVATQTSEHPGHSMATVESTLATQTVESGSMLPHSGRYTKLFKLQQPVICLYA